MKYLLILLFFLSLSILCSCQDLQQREGFVYVQGGRIWYKIIGDGDGIPLLVVHGGPGGRSCGSEVRVETLYSFQRMTENAQCAIISGAGHAKTTDQPEEYIQALDHFLKEVER